MLIPRLDELPLDSLDPFSTQADDLMVLSKLGEESLLSLQGYREYPEPRNGNTKFRWVSNVLARIARTILVRRELMSFSERMDQLGSSGELRVINTRQGKADDQLAVPIAGVFVDLPSLGYDEPLLVVSNAYYFKHVQIMTQSGTLVGTIKDERYVSASAIASDGQNIYISSNSDGYIAKFSISGEKLWEIQVPEVTHKLSHLVSSMAILGNKLYAYNNLASKLQVFDTNTGELLDSIGRQKTIRLADLAKGESLELDGELLFNGHQHMAVIKGQIGLASSGCRQLNIPNLIKLVKDDLSQHSEMIVSSEIGNVTGIAADDSRERVFLAINNKIVVVENDRYIGWFPAPSCSDAINNIFYDQRADRLLIMSGGLSVDEGGDSAISILTPEAIGELTNFSRGMEKLKLKQAAKPKDNFPSSKLTPLFIGLTKEDIVNSASTLR